MGTLVPDCDDFYLHLSSNDSSSQNPADFTVNLPAPRSLRGKWKMALKEVQYTKWDKEKAYNEEMEFIIFADGNNTAEFLSYYNWLIETRRVRPIYQYNSTQILGIPNARVVAWYNETNQPQFGTVTDPEGQYANPADFVREVNNKLHEMFMKGHFHDAPHYYLIDKETAFKTAVLSWNYPAGKHRKIGIMPILGKRNRRLLGIPEDYTNHKMLRLITSTFASASNNYYPDLEMGEEGFTQKTDNIFVLCNLVRSTGARIGIEGLILRVIPNRQEEQGRVIHFDFTEDYYSVTPKSSFFSVTLKLVSSRDYHELNLVHPTSFTLHFQPINECTPEARRVNA